MALQHLRFGVTASAAVLALCLLAQIGVWAAVHFTDVRLTQVTPPRVENPALKVVKSAPSATEEKASPAKALPGLSAAEAAEVNHVPGPTHVRLRRVTGLVQSFGVLSAIVFAVLCFQGVMLAGGAALPGVEKTVTAGTWSMIIAMLSLPISAVVPTLPFPGVFAGFDSTVRLSEAVRQGADGAPGAIGYFAWNLGVPLVLIVGIALVLWRFRGGIEAGIIVTNVSQLDEKLEREIRNMRLGQLSAPRAMGALNAALGDPSGAYAPPPVAQAPPHARPMGAPTAVMPEQAAPRRPLEPVGPPEYLDPKRRPI